MLFSCLTFLGCLLGEPMAVDPASIGPYRVGVLTIDVKDETRPARRLTTEVWYPTLDNGSLPAPKYASGILTQAIRDAAPAKGPFPWIVFSHGLSAIREQSTFLAEHLVTHGYIVVAPDHQHNTGRDFRPLEIYQSAYDRPMDMRAVMDAVILKAKTPDDPLFGRVAIECVAAMGQSLGGYTALATGGAWVRARSLPPVFGGPDHPSYYDLSDPRIRAVVAYAPVCKPAFDDRSLSHMKIPTLVVGGTEDTVTPFEKNQLPIFEGIQGPAYLALIKGASHFNFNNEEMIQTAPFFIRGMHRPTIDRTISDTLVRRLTLAFLDRYLIGADRYAQYLAEEQPNVCIQSKGTVLPPLPAGP